MKNCPDREKLHSFLDGDLPEEEKSQFRVHLSQCTDCAEFVEKWTSFQSVLRANSESGFSEQFVSDVMARVSSVTTEGKGALFRSFIVEWKYQLLGAVFSILLLLFQGGVEIDVSSDMVLMSGFSGVSSGNLVSSRTYSIEEFLDVNMEAL